MADENFKPGTMNIEEQEKTFSGFMNFTRNAVIVIFIVLLILAIFGA